MMNARSDYRDEEGHDDIGSCAVGRAISPIQGRLVELGEMVGINSARAGPDVPTILRRNSGRSGSLVRSVA
jgi:hypothetical protein